MIRRAEAAWRLVFGLAAALVLLCAPPRIAARDRPSPIERALGFLSRHQLTEPLDLTTSAGHVVDFAGDWPQYFHLPGSQALSVRDVSPFMVAFIHHALTRIVASDREALGLTPSEVDGARAMRERAVAFIRRFASPPDAPDGGTFGFWPYDTDPSRPTPFVADVLTAWLKGPILGGARVPINLPIFPDALAIPSDADVTATTYATLLDDEIIDGGPGTETNVARFFIDWRDLGVVPRRLNPSWLPPASGAFLTWLTYREDPLPRYPNDVDLVVNANVLYALARYHRLDAPGVADAVGYINAVTASGLFRDHLDEITDYYPANLSFHYMVSRACREGPVPALEPAVRVLADDLEASALVRPDGTVYWDDGDPHLNTAFAVLTLLNAGRHTPTLDRGIAYLAGEQNVFGGFDAATFFVARADGGQVSTFGSSAFTTAMALEAFARYALSAPRH